MTRHRLAILHQRFFTLSIIPVSPVSLLYPIHMTYTCTHVHRHTRLVSTQFTCTPQAPTVVSFQTRSAICVQILTPPSTCTTVLLVPSLLIVLLIDIPVYSEYVTILQVVSALFAMTLDERRAKRPLLCKRISVVVIVSQQRFFFYKD
jgi:hypothetical protein